MDFIRHVKLSRLLEPGSQQTPGTRRCEVRIDPLTGRSTRILDFPTRPVAPPELDGLIQKSKLMCPFCPESLERVTPCFMSPLEPRYLRGEANCFPNAFPYDENGAVIVISHAHYLALADFGAQLLTDAIACSCDYLAAVGALQREAVFQSINWNYMPLAGGSLVHPHLQASASVSPTNYCREVLNGLENYRRRTGQAFWHELVAAEQEQGERFVAQGARLSWLVAFAPLGVFDVIGLMPGLSSPAELAGDLLAEVVEGLCKVLGFIDALGMHSLNMSIYFKTDEPDFVPHLRICPRVSIPPFGASQVNYLRMLHDESLTTVRPEDVCADLRAFWGNNQSL
ncbi:MAG: hypothetical protein BWY87_00409 [Deltaproteobacteria bacterium ADurb.Bin510]|nr:MAG: hypothetical protein BWY87_00409 [Deltaproteobacteria bacterium ADurb.Bin510]